MSYRSGVDLHARAGYMAILGALYLLMGVLARKRAKQSSTE